MNSTDKHELDLLSEWASRNENKHIFLAASNEDEDSFWMTRENEDSYIMAYDFRTLPEFEKLCLNIFGKKFDKEIQRIISVAAFKHSGDYEEMQKKEKTDDRLPEHIYVF